MDDPRYHNSTIRSLILLKTGSGVYNYNIYRPVLNIGQRQYPRRPTQSGTVPLFVEQFHNLWNSSTICGTASQKCGTAPKKSGTSAESGSLFHKLWNSSTNCGTAPISCMLFQDVKQCATFNCVSHRSISSHKLLFRIIVMHIVLCKFMVEDY